LLVVAVSLAAGAALAGAVMSTNPDACAVLRASRVKPVLGSTAVQFRQPFELPEPTKYQSNPRRLVDALHTGCTWVDQRRGTFVNVQVYQQNPDYAGKQPWTPQSGRNTLAAISTRGYYLLVDNDAEAKRRRSPWLAGEDIMLVVDRATRGKRKAILATDPTDDLWIVVNVVGGGRSALDVATAVTRQLLGG